MILQISLLIDNGDRLLDNLDEKGFESKLVTHKLWGFRCRKEFGKFNLRIQIYKTSVIVGNDCWEWLLRIAGIVKLIEFTL